ncbi:hypothetical protein [Anabaena azotica]|uniref:Uncharacterized protein n=1 Tax=Anabaena azotica FACHB-119 TaxID=947527 RepID=A0ABR8D9N3_9NOST|nr:hypothetical protein [Anabaena azotica]MBD2503910.1 hypothetical protein [Anabaena azotica FACHB-119]
MKQEYLTEDYPYPIEVLDDMTQLVQRIRFKLYKKKCSFGEACQVAAIVLRKAISKEIDLESLKSMLPSFLENVRMSNKFCELED